MKLIAPALVTLLLVSTRAYATREAAHRAVGRAVVDAAPSVSSGRPGGGRRRAGLGTAAGPAAPTLAAQLARIDELHRRRDEHAAWTEEQQLVQATLARAPADYGVLWRAARFYFWLSDDPNGTSDQRSQLGTAGLGPGRARAWP